MSEEWGPELVPDDAYLLMRVHRVDLDANGTPKPGAFKNRPQGATGMSTDWDLYATPESTRRSGRKPPEEYAVVSLPVGPVRDIEWQEVVHSPIRENRAHTEVVGPKDPEVRLALRRLHRLEILISPGPDQ